MTAYDNDRYIGEGDGIDDVIGSTKPLSFADLATQGSRTLEERNLDLYDPSGRLIIGRLKIRTQSLVPQGSTHLHGGHVHTTGHTTTTYTGGHVHHGGHVHTTGTTRYGGTVSTGASTILNKMGDHLKGQVAGRVEDRNVTRNETMRIIIMNAEIYRDGECGFFWQNRSDPYVGFHYNG